MTDARVSTEGDPLPDVLMDHLVYPTATLLLRSPLHALVSDELLLVSFTDPGTGELRSEPVGYHESSGGADVVAFTTREWADDLREDESVTLTLHGDDVSATVEPVSEPRRVAKHLRAFLQREGVDAAPRVGLDIEGEGVPSREELAEAVEDGGMTALLFDVQEE